MTRNIGQDIEAIICARGEACISDLRYRIGTQTTDTHGAGNIIFGYFARKLGISVIFEEVIANADQTIRTLFGEFRLVLRDEPDDIVQREVGWCVAAGSPTIQLLEGCAQTMNLR